MQASAGVIERAEDYGLIRPSLIKQLKSILDQYPDNGQILKELLQNAEDAGAQRVQFLYDKNSYADTKLHSPDMAPFQGPALYAYNDAQFTEQDWTGIRMLQDSIKETDSTKIGRFGLGFKSVFHLTDLPSVLSGERVFFIDPHERFFQYQGSRTSGYMWNIAERQADLLRIPDQFAPFSSGIFGCTGETLRNGCFSGTMFRFPLRSTASELSATIYSEDRVETLFAQFRNEAKLLLVFLKNVWCVEICSRAEGSRDSPVSFRAEVSAECRDEVRRSRCRLTDAIKTRATENISCNYLFVVELTEFNEHGTPVSQKSFRYLVNEYYAGGQVSKSLTELRNDASLCLVPLVGTALSMDEECSSKNTLENSKNKLEEQNGSQDGSTEVVPFGQIFCSLPLAAQEKSATGFPIHVNGFFAVTQNRQHLKWPVSGQRVETDKCLMWNQCLITNLVPRSYQDLILSAVRYSKLPHKSIYAALPDITKVDDKWQSVIDPLYQNLLEQPIFYASRRNGKAEWMKLNHCVIDRLHHESIETRSVVVSSLVDANVPVAADVDNHIIFAICACGKAPEIVTPDLVREALRNHSESYVHLERSAKLLLLDYVLKDRNFRDMDGLNLLPLANGSFARVTCAKDASRLFIPTDEFPASLLPTLTGLLIGMDGLEEQLCWRLRKMALEGCTQVTPLTSDLVCKLLPKVIPKSWHEQLCVDWESSKCSLPDDWLTAVWLFLRTHCPSTLSQFRGHPILPLIINSSITLVPLMLNTCVVLRSGAGSTLTSGLANVLGHLGVVIADDLPQFVRDHAAVIGDYVRLPIVDDLVEVMHNSITIRGAKERFIETIRSKTSESEKAEVRELISWLNPRSVKPQHLAFLKRLPIFPCATMSAREDSAPVFCSVEEVGKVAPVEHLPFSTTGTRYLSVAGDACAMKAATLLGAKCVNITSVLRETLTDVLNKGFPDDAVADSVAQGILKNLSAYIVEDPGIADVLSKVPFVRTRHSGRRAAPSTLFDPEQPGLRHTLADADAFPADDYTQSGSLVHLRQIGLKSFEQLTGGDLLASMLRIEYLSKTPETFSLARTYSLAVLEFLGRSPGVLFQEANGRLLVEWASNIAWVAPVMEKPALFPSSVKWFVAAETIHTPREVTGSQWSSVIGAVLPVVSCDLQVSQAFGWDARPSVSDVARQLSYVSSSYTSLEKANYLAMLSDIYGVLYRADCQSVLVALDKSSCPNWIWHGDGFTSRDRVVIKKPATDMRPYVYTLPSEMHPFVEFLSKCGVQQNCGPETSVRLLKEMRHKYDVGEFTSDDEAGDIQLAVGLLNELAHHKLSDDAFKELLVICQASDNAPASFVLHPVLDCTYCDLDWLRRGFDITEFNSNDGVTFVHSQLPLSTAAALGVPTLMSRMLHAEELVVTNFGQSEPLTNRLRTLLEDYSDGLAIPKEIIQNADDAGASEVCFAFDERNNNDHMKYLIDEGMRQCQGPALWAYNDATFTERDFESITRLGGAMKESELDKIGRFGLGFNAVYNITDVPSFVTRDVLCIFDPHTTHLGRGIRDHSRPGVRINLDKNRMLLRKLPDQFLPYEGMFGCHLTEPSENPVYYDGTLFRLPLRNREQAARSEISNLHYDRDRVFSLVQILAQNANNILVFSQNVRKISFYHIPADGDPQAQVLMFSVSKSVMNVIRPLEPCSDWMNKLTRRAVETEKEIVLSRNCGFLRAAAEYTKAMKLSSSVQSKKASTELKSPRSSLIVRVSVVIQQEAGFMGLNRKDSADCFWLVSSCVGSSQSMKMALTQLKKFLVPAAGVACLLEPVGDGHYTPKSLGRGVGASKGRAFCYMPLPIDTGLPVHINSAFALHSNRRQLSRLTEDETTNALVEWNQALLEDAVCGAYVQLLVDVQAVVLRDVECPLYDLWPAKDSVDTNFDRLVKRFYECAVQLNAVPLMYCKNKPVTMDKVVFLDGSIASSELAIQAAKEVFMSACGGKTVSALNDSMYKSFLAFGLKEAVQGIVYDAERFYGEIFFPNLYSVAPEAQRFLILFAIGLRSRPLEALLKGHPCIPSSPDGAVLRRPCDLIHPTCKAAILYSPEDGRFPHHVQFQDPSVLVVLEQLGLVVGDLEWNDVLERCASLQSTWESDRQLGRTRQRALMLFLDRLLLGSAKSQRLDADLFVDVGLFEKLTLIPILSVLPKPLDFPLTWAGETQLDQLMSASEAYTSDCAYLVSATCCIVDSSVLSARVQDFLGLADNRPSLGHVVTQMEHALNVDLSSLSDRQLGEFQRCMNSLYSFLQEQCLADPIAADHISSMLAERPCILHDRTFLRSNQVAVDFPYNCSPYLYSLPVEMSAKFPSLMSLLGVKRRFEVGSYMGVLNDLNTKSAGKPLGEKDLDLAVRMVTQLNSAMKITNASAADVERDYGPILVPNAMGCLSSADSLYFNDCPWLSDAKLVSFVHPDLTFQASVSLGVRTKRQEALRPYSSGIPFGQKERLTNSLRRLLDSYPFDHEILKELIQNADDAGATEIHFVVDNRSHSDVRVFDASWRPLQGPALCVYNNRPFSDGDLDGIQRFGEGSKARDPASTGQYGIGFSSVYHLTDVPSLLTSTSNGEDMLCVFDPMCKYVPGATVAEPGMRYSNIDALKVAFPDVFSCYMEDLFPRGGTIFRLPFRTRPMAEVSEISKTVVTTSRVQSIFEQLKAEAFEILLFTNCLEEISISAVDHTTGKLTDTYTVKALLSKNDRISRENLVDAKRKMAKDSKGDMVKELNSAKPQDSVLTLLITDNRGCQEKWIVSHRVGFDVGLKLPMDVVEAFSSGELALLPCGGVACQVETRLHGQLTTSSRPRRAFCFLPLPVETDLPVHVNGHFALGYENRRHLWTNAETAGGFRRQWNDLLCEAVVAPAYVNLLSTLRMQGLNCTVLGENTTRVTCSRPMLDSALQAFMAFFPGFSSTKPEWSVLSTAVYTKIDRDTVPVLASVCELTPTDPWRGASGQNSKNEAKSWQLNWLPPISDGSCSVFFRKTDVSAESLSSQRQTSLLGKFKGWFGMSSETSPERQAEEVVEEVLLRCGLKLVESTPELYENFRRAGVEVSYMSAESVITFFQDNLAGSLVDLPQKLENTPFRDEKTLKTVFKYVSSNSGFSKQLDGLPLLMKADGTVDRFSTAAPVFLSEFSDLVPNSSHLFTKWNSFPDLSNSSTSHLGVFQDFTIAHLAELLPSVLPSEFFSNESGQVAWLKNNNSLPTSAWISRLWAFIKMHHSRSVRSQDADDEVEESDENVVNCFSDLLAPLTDWCIVPAKSYSGHFLFTPSSAAEAVLDVRNPKNEHRLVGIIMQRLRFPELDISAMHPESDLDSRVVSTVAVTLDKPWELLVLLNRRFTSSKREEMTTSLSVDNCNQLLKYFSANVDALKSAGDDAAAGDESAPAAADLLRDLPIYKTICGAIIPLTGCFVYSLPEKIPTNGIDAWQSRSGTVFLASNDAVQPLYDFIGCASIGPLDVYCRFIFQHFEYFPRDDRLVHVHHVYTQYLKASSTLSVEERDALVDSLRELAFLEDEDGELQPANYFYDPENVVFRVMLPGGRFAAPADRLFKNSEWFEFLGLLGMVRTITPEKFIEFAKTVEVECSSSLSIGDSSSSSSSALTKSKVLVKHLYSASDLLNGSAIDEIVGIPFVYPERVPASLSSEHSQYGDVENNGHVGPISFRDAVERKHAKLCWTSCNLLPSWADLEAADQDLLADRLQIQLKPRLDTVMRHLQNLCGGSASERRTSSDQRSSRIGVFRAIYRYLDEMDIDESTAEDLGKLACVLVDDGRRLVLPGQTVLNMYDSDEIKPYLYRLPLDMAEHRRLFLRIGASDRATVAQYVDALGRIRAEAGSNKMTPNELVAAHNAVRGLLNALESSSYQQRDVGSAVLYLPTEDGKLSDSSRLVFNDAPAYFDRVREYNLRFVADLRNCFGVARGQVSAIDDLLGLLPSRQRPSMLSALVQETLVDSCRSASSKSSGLAQFVGDRLRSEEFLRTVVRLVRHEAHKSGRKVDETAMFDVLDRLSTIVVRGAPRIATHLVLKGRPIAGSEVEKSCYVERAASAIPDVQCWNVFIKDDVEESSRRGGQMSQDLLISLAETINGILSGILHDSVLYLLPALSCSDADKIDSCMDGLNVRVDHSSHRSSVSSSAVASSGRGLVLPTVGSTVSDEVRTLCQPCGSANSKDLPVSDFRPGEYVGYRRHEPDGNDVIVYGVILEELVSPDNSEQMYLIDLGGGQNGIITSQSRLCKFVRQ